ncbi:MAG TPA: GerMN domain-containing protein [Candidatus Paceibacterota bacterium]|nr:GerMN domain-containing protein [Candidatus Paceibacterota bacterium]
MAILVIVAVLVVIGVIMTRDTTMIIVESPRPNEQVTSPLVVSGKARGGWFFEASFPVELLGAQGEVLAFVPAQAGGEWMTEDFVPFSATLSFDIGAAQQGTLVLMKDNPSGLPEHDAQIVLPLRLEPSSPAPVAAEMTVQAFFGRSDAPAGEECTTIAIVPRTVPATQAVARAALTELLEGPTGEERVSGFMTSIPSGGTIRSLTIENGTAFVDLSGELQTGVSGSCRVTHIRRQIESTLKQFPTVTSVVISVDGRTDDILQP